MVAVVETIQVAFAVWFHVIVFCILVIQAFDYWRRKIR